MRVSSCHAVRDQNRLVYQADAELTPVLDAVLKRAKIGL